MRQWFEIMILSRSSICRQKCVREFDVRRLMVAKSRVNFSRQGGIGRTKISLVFLDEQN